MPKHNIDRETYEHIQRIYDHAKDQELPEKWDRSWASTVATCAHCDVKFDMSRPVNPGHRPGCVLASSLAFMETWLRVEGGLVEEQEDGA